MRTPFATYSYLTFPLYRAMILLKDWESGNHRITERLKWEEMPGPTSLLMQGPLKYITPDYVQTVFEQPQGRRLHSFLGNLLQCSVTFTFNWNFLSVTITSFLILGHRWKELGPILLTPSLQILYTLIRSTQSLLFSLFIIWVMLQFLHHLSSPLCSL